MKRRETLPLKRGRSQCRDQPREFESNFVNGGVLKRLLLLLIIIIIPLLLPPLDIHASKQRGSHQHSAKCVKAERAGAVSADTGGKRRGWEGVSVCLSRGGNPVKLLPPWHLAAHQRARKGSLVGERLRAATRSGKNFQKAPR